MSRVMSSNSSTTSQNQQTTSNVAKEKIAMRAYEKWCKRGRPHGTDRQDWIEAENELKAESTRNGGSQTNRR